MTTYYIAELQNRNSYRKAEKIDAKTLTAAKRVATRRQAFQGTVLEIGTTVNSQGFILNPIAVRENGRWKTFDKK
jgi:hypothetical protein